MGVEIGKRVVVLRDTGCGGRKDLDEGTLVTVVATRPNQLGPGLMISVCRDGETKRHGVHSSEIAPIQSRPITEMSVVDMVERFFKVEQASIVVQNDLPECDALNADREAIFKALPGVPSRTHADIVAKLRFAMDYAEMDGSCFWLESFMNTLGRDYRQMVDFVDEQEMAIVEKANSFEEYFALVGEPMPEPIAAE